MSEVIVRMEMPKCCFDCPMHDWTVNRCEMGELVCNAHHELKPIPNGNERPDWCPIIGELPEQHGRLVDADCVALAMVEKGQGSSRYKFGEMWELNGLEIREAFQTVSTIVPATERSET